MRKPSALCHTHHPLATLGGGAFTVRNSVPAMMWHSPTRCAWEAQRFDGDQPFPSGCRRDEFNGPSTQTYAVSCTMGDTEERGPATRRRIGVGAGDAYSGDSAECALPGMFPPIRARRRPPAPLVMIDRHERAHVARMEVQGAPRVRVGAEHHRAPQGLGAGRKGGDLVDLQDNHVAGRAGAFLFQESPHRRLGGDRAHELQELITDSEDIVLQPECGHAGIPVPRGEPKDAVQLVDHLVTIAAATAT